MCTCTDFYRLVPRAVISSYTPEKPVELSRKRVLGNGRDVCAVVHGHLLKVLRRYKRVTRYIGRASCWDSARGRMRNVTLQRSLGFGTSCQADFHLTWARPSSRRCRRPVRERRLFTVVHNATTTLSALARARHCTYYVHNTRGYFRFQTQLFTAHTHMIIDCTAHLANYDDIYTCICM